MKLQANVLFVFITLLFSIHSCNNSQEKARAEPKIPVIFDTDANNELDDQHALAYLLSNQEIFEIVGVTVNATRNGGLILEHYDEAMRILTLFNEEDLPLKKGANQTFGEIRANLSSGSYDGSEAVDFIIEETKKCEAEKMVVIAIGKLTNVALAVEKDPEIMDKIRLVWLGSNYPEPGEYNLENDTSALTYLLASDIQFEMVNVAYGSTRGTDYIRVSVPEVDSIMPGKGPHVDPGITGRHGGTFHNFGDYSVNLFHHIDVYGDPPSRALFDVGAVAVVKNPAWGESSIIPAPKYILDQWIEQPDNERRIILWENFRKEAIIKDFYDVID
ncbi:nucleoside hydrolase [Bacteroidota bacterium]